MQWFRICPKVRRLREDMTIELTVVGAAMAVEDGAALAEALDHIGGKSEIPFALSIFEKVRKERAGQMQDASLLNGTIWHYADGPEQKARDAAMRPEVEGQHFIHSPNQWSDPVTQWWCYGYDAEEAVAQAVDTLSSAKSKADRGCNGHV